MFNNKRNNVVLVALAIILACAVIVGVGLLVFGDFIIPLVKEAAPYSYLTVLVVILAALFFAT